MKKYLERCPKRNLAENYIDIYNNEIFPNIKKCHLMENVSDSGIYRFCDSMISHYFEYIYNNETNNVISRCSNENIKKFYDFCIEYYDSFRGFNEYSAFMIYKLFQHIFKNMYNVIKYKRKLKMMMIGGHDVTVGQFMNFLDRLQIIPRTHYPHYACNIVIELRKYNQDFYLEFYYNDILKYNNTLEKFKNILDNSIYSNLYNYCGKPSKTINAKAKIIIQNKTQKNESKNIENSKIESNFTLNSIKNFFNIFSKKNILNFYFFIILSLIVITLLIKIFIFIYINKK